MDCIFEAKYTAEFTVTQHHLNFITSHSLIKHNRKVKLLLHGTTLQHIFAKFLPRTPLMYAQYWGGCCRVSPTNTPLACILSIEAAIAEYLPRTPLLYAQYWGGYSRLSPTNTPSVYMLSILTASSIGFVVVVILQPQKFPNLLYSVSKTISSVQAYIG